MSVIKMLLSSKKFLVLVSGILVLILRTFLGLDEATAYKIAAMITGYLLGQGISDGFSGGLTSSMPGTPTVKDSSPN